MLSRYTQSDLPRIHWKHCCYAFIMIWVNNPALSLAYEIVATNVCYVYQNIYVSLKTQMWKLTINCNKSYIYESNVFRQLRHVANTMRVSNVYECLLEAKCLYWGIYCSYPLVQG